jgi:nucleoid-associated protein YgaU
MGVIGKLRNPFKFERLKIEAYDNGDVKKIIGKFEAQFNPTEIKKSYAIAWDTRAVVNATGTEHRYTSSGPAKLSLKLIFDGTGVDSYGFTVIFGKVDTVKKRVDDFLNVTHNFQPDIHQPPFLVISWGAQDRFQCRLELADVTYTLFDRGGAPLRAELNATFVQDTTTEVMARTQNKNSPDVSHARVVRSGDTLPMMTEAIYGSSQRYLDVARYNGLDDFRILKPGQVLLFPPLTAFTTGAGKPSGRG